ncbi:UNVERIFIED_ORG: peptide/nickel transport system permease protein [Methylorubrum zatmanii]|uniref:ABC transporter permease n=1 Tax=Methylorubrum extorquens TaxID=408 RepID=UPI0035A1A199|nr:peptide/nickel transport system permease protein [Methylorubrum extorquens]
MQDLAGTAPPRSDPWPISRRIGLGLLALLAAFAFLGPVVVSADPARQDLSASLAPIGSDFLLGADHYGRSMLARLAYGARLSFGMALLTMLSAAVPGLLLGVLAAWRGGVTERALVALSDIVLALPGLLLVLLLLAFAPGHFLPLYLGLSLSLWVEFFRVARTTTARLLVEPRIEASRLLGFGTFYILRHQVLPEIAPLLLTLASFAMGTAILAISTLSAISVGLQPPTPELGSMIVELLPYYDEAPLAVLMPGILIFLLVLGLQLTARGGTVR